MPEPIYPHKAEPGNVAVIGPECFASDDKRVICWRGVNYVPQEALAQAKGSVRLMAEEVEELAARLHAGADEMASALKPASDEEQP